MTASRRPGIKGNASAGIVPVDVAILGQLPAEGTVLTEYIPLGTTANAVRKRLDNVVSPAQIGGRLVALQLMGYVVSVPVMPVSKGKGWQRTPKADALLERVKEIGIIAAVTEANDAFFASIQAVAGAKTTTEEEEVIDDE